MSGFRQSGSSLEVTESGLALPIWDALSNLDATATTDVFRYFHGGLSGTQVALVTITYTDASKSVIETVVKEVPGASGGGGSDLLHQVTVTLTNAQIITLPSLPVEVLAAPGADAILFPQFFLLRANHWVANYTNLTGQTIFKLGTAQISNGIDSGDFFGLGDPADSVMAFSIITQSADGSNVLAVAGDYDSDLRNKALNITASNAGDFTGGDAGNTVTVSVAYLQLNTTTGLFE